MELTKKELLMEQANKITEIINVFTENFDDTDLADESITLT